MTNKIALEALKLKGFQNPTAIAEILSYVPNQNAALEMLLGIYEPRQIMLAERFRKHKYDSHKEIAEIVKYDDLGNTVEYKVYEQKTVQAYYLTPEDKKNEIYTLERPKNYHDWSYVKANGYTEKVNVVSIEAFEDNFNGQLSNENAFALLEEWENFGIPQYEYIEKDPTDLMLDCH